MTATTTARKAKRTVSQPAAVTDEQHMEAIKILREKCFELRFTIGRLPTSRKADRKAAEEIAKLMKGSRKGIRTSWSMFSVDHPRVAELNAVLTDLQRFRDSFAVMEDSKKAGATNAKDDDGKKQSSQEGGKRIIWADDHKEIYTKIVELSARVDTAAQKVQDAMEEVKALDRKAAGDLWEESAYPSDVRLIVGVPKDSDGNYIVDFAPTVAIPENLDRDIKEQVVRRAMGKLSGSLELTVDSAVKNLNDGLSTFMAELVNRVRINPVKGHEFEQYCTHGQAEVLKIKTPDHDRAIPAGHITLYIQYKEAPEGVENPTADELETVKKWVGPILDKDYRVKVRPLETGEVKKIFPSVIENLITRMQSFRDKQSALLGEHGKNVDGAFTALFETFAELRRYGESNNKVGQNVASKLRASPEFKADVASVVVDTIEALDNAVAEVKKVRRRINSKLIGKV